jgi:hypothetical protein
MEISEREALRYLGYRGAAADERTTALIGGLAAELDACVNPKSTFAIYDCRVDPPAVEFGGVTVNSANLAGHLKGCRRAALFAATLGAGADTLIRRHSVRDMEKAAVAQAVCAAMIEAYCDLVEGEIARSPDAGGLCPVARFSPGYGDFDIIHQKDILRLLNCAKIGLALTDGYMLTPSKSVTAVIGLTEGEKRVKGKCEGCADINCAFRGI